MVILSKWTYVNGGAMETLITLNNNIDIINGLSEVMGVITNAQLIILNASAVNAVATDFPL